MNDKQDHISPVKTLDALTYTSGTLSGKYISRPNRINEDAILVCPPSGATEVWLVALFDGMSSGGAGASASDAAREAIESLWSQSEYKPDNSTETIYMLMAKAQQAVLGALRGSAGGTTCLIAIIDGGLLTFGHVGDNQLWYNGKQITVDQTPLYRTLLGQKMQNKAQQLVEKGEVLNDDDYYHYGVLENQLTRYLGHPHMGDYEAEKWVEIGQIGLKKGDSLFICTDGILKAVNVSSLTFQSDNVESNAKEITRQVSAYREEGDADDATFFLLGVKEDLLPYNALQPKRKNSRQPQQKPVPYRQVNFAELGEDGRVASAVPLARPTERVELGEDRRGASAVPLARPTEHTDVPEPSASVLSLLLSRLLKPLRAMFSKFGEPRSTTQDDLSSADDRKGGMGRSILPLVAVALVAVAGVLIFLSFAVGGRLAGSFAGSVSQSATAVVGNETPSATTDPLSRTTALVEPPLPPSPITSTEPITTSVTPTPTQPASPQGDSFAAPRYAPFTRPPPNGYISPADFLQDVFGLSEAAANYGDYDSTTLDCGGSLESAWKCLSPNVALPNLLPPEPWVAFAGKLEEPITGPDSEPAIISVGGEKYELQFSEPNNTPKMDRGATVAIIGLLKPVANRNTATWTGLQTNAEEFPVVEVYFISVLKNGETIEWKRPTQGNPDIFSRPLWIYTTQDALEWLLSTPVNPSDEWGVDSAATHYLLDSRWEPDPAGSDGMRKLNVRAVYTFREGEYRCALDISSGRSGETCTP